MNRTLRVGIFTAIGVFLIVGFSIYVNDHPYWYRACNEVKIHVDDATGLRRKSPVKSLGLEIGYIKEVTLDGDQVLVRVCVTGPVKLNADTKAYIRSSGFLGDKFLELKPVDLIDSAKSSASGSSSMKLPAEDKSEDELKNSSAAPEREIQEVEVVPVEMSIEPKKEDSTTTSPSSTMLFLLDLFTTEARAEETQTLSASRETEIQDTVKKVGKLIDQLTLMVGDLREVTQQKEFKETIINLNGAMKHLETVLRPNGKMMKNLDQSVESLKNTMRDAEALMAKIKAGEGTIGKFINDPSIYDEMKSAIKSVNLLLGKAGALKTYIDLAAYNIPAYEGTKARFSLLIAPNPGRYYLIGLANDPRGRDIKTTTTTRVNYGTATVEEKTVNEEKGLRITAMLGKYFGPLDLRAGLIEDNGGVTIGFWLDEDRRYGVLADIYSPGKKDPITARITAKAHIWSGAYITGGVDSLTRYKGKTTYFAGAGLFFDDDDIKYLFAFR